MTVSDEAMRELAALAGVVLAHEDLAATLTEICRIAARAVPGAEGASVTTFPEGRPGALASDDWARTLDESQTAHRKLREVAEAIVTDAIGGSAVSSA